MRDLLQHADEVPVTLLVAVAYVTLAFLTDPFQPTGEQLAAHGWLTPLLVAHGEPWRLFSSAFLHGGILHLVFNLSMLLGVGPALERSLGSVRFAVLYLVAALGGSVAVCLWYDVGQPVVGGSGALFGMMGALVAINMRAGRHAFAFLDFEGPRRLISMIVANLVIGMLLPFISNTAHVGGLLWGFAVTFLWLVPPREASAALRHWRLACAALLASLVFASLMPVTRYDWLWNSSLVTGDPARQAAMRRAAAMSFLGAPSATDLDAQQFYETVVAPPQSEKPRPRGR